MKKRKLMDASVGQWCLLSILACVLALLGSHYIPFDNEWIATKNLVSQVFSTILAATFLFWLWDFRLKRTFREEILETVGLKMDVERYGIVSVLSHKKVPWETYMQDSQFMKCFFAYAGSWRRFNMPSVRKMIADGKEVMVYLPNPENAVVTASLANNFYSNIDDQKAKIDAARQELEEAGCKVEVREITPAMSLYLLQNIAVLVLYSHVKGQIDEIPVFVGKRGGKLYSFIEDEFKIIENHGVLQ